MTRKMLALSLAVAAAMLVVRPVSALPPGAADATLSWSPGTPEPGHDVTFSIRARDPDGIVLSAVVEYGDGTRATIHAPRSLAKDVAACLFGDTFVGTVRKQYAQVGAYPVRLTVTSGACPLTEALQESTIAVSYTLEVARGASARAPVGGDSLLEARR